ncbi:MAG: bacillithiol biosynthesis deacetylase BshB1 [Bacteroidota bacterium]
MKLDILAFAAHPDDVELSCSGTLIKHIKLGYKVGICDLTRGELGTRGSAELRKIEATNASKIIGNVVRENLGFADGFFSNDKEHQLKIIEVIRKYQPEIVICNAISDRHPDHSRGSKVVSEACFYAGLTKIETNNNGVKQNAWRPKNIYHYIQFRYIEPDFVVDISDELEQKIESVKAYSSQFYQPGSNEPETAISSKQFFDSISERASEFGKTIGVKSAEGFTKERYLGVNNLFDLK